MLEVELLELLEQEEHLALLGQTLPLTNLSFSLLAVAPEEELCSSVSVRFCLVFTTFLSDFDL